MQQNATHTLLHLLDRNVHRSVRDLAWCISSPPIIDSEFQLYKNRAVTQDWCDQHFQRFTSHLISLAQDPSCLLSWCSSRPTQRLGRYFEALISYWLHHTPGVIAVHESLQVKQDKLTIGEFDFLFYDQLAQSHIHLEVAVKFYLRLGSSLSLADYVGPSGVDRLDRKMNLLFEKQLNLGGTTAGARLIRTIYGSATVKSMALVKGMIFDPIDEMMCNTNYDKFGVSPNCLRGFWLHLADLREFTKDQPARRWTIVPRLYWLSQLVTSDPDQILTGEGICLRVGQHFDSHPDPVMIATLEFDRDLGQWVDKARAFVLNAKPTLE